MTWFGVVYIVLTVIGIVSKIGEIGKPRKPVTHADVSLSFLLACLILWGLFVVGVTHA